jgi:hypothetical protein
LMQVGCPEISGPLSIVCCLLHFGREDDFSPCCNIDVPGALRYIYVNRSVTYVPFLSGLHIVQRVRVKLFLLLWTHSTIYIHLARTKVAGILVLQSI